MDTIEELNYDDDYYQYCSLLKQLTNIDPDNISSEMFKNRLSMIKSNPYHKILVFKKDNKIVGSITILVEPKFIHNCSYVAHIEDVVVDSEYRTHGIGRILMNKAISIAVDFQCYKIILDCSEKASGFYKKLDFYPKEIQMVKYLSQE